MATFTAVPDLTGVERLVDANTAKVLEAFIDNRIGEEHLAGSNGYGHDDLGREALERVYAQVFRAEAALVRPHFASGTHAIACALFGCLSPGDELLAVAGAPYDTMEEVIGIRGEGQGSLMDWGVSYREIPLQADGRVDMDTAVGALSSRSRVALIQRSRGYTWRPSLDIATIETLISRLKAAKPDLICLVDNCYGEFTEPREPIEAGADLVAGSLIKNPGAGIVPCGGYLAGREDLVERAACRLYAPGIGRAGGATLDFTRWALQGFFMAPQIVGESLKGAIYAAHLFQQLGYDVSPGPGDARTDIIQAIRLGSPNKLIQFCGAVQASSPVGSYVKPIADVVPGYGDNVVMAGGTFVEGSTVELSADGPLREPYVAYLQGGLSFSHVKWALHRVVQVVGSA